MVMMIALFLSTLVLGAPPMPPTGTSIAVPEHFYRRIETVAEMPDSYGRDGWMEGHFGNWLEASRASGQEAVAAIRRRLGKPLRLPAWGSSAPREAYVFASRTSVEAGLLILVETKAKRVVLRSYTSPDLPFGARIRPPGLEWGAMLMTWFRWLTTPDAKLPPHIREAGATHPFTMAVNGEDWIMPGMHLPMIAGAAMNRPGVPRPGGKVVVPDQFYTPVTDVADLPAGYGEPGWMEKPYPPPVRPRAEGTPAVAAALENLGPPLTLPPTATDTAPREGWVFTLEAHPEAGLLAILDRQAATVELRIYASPRLPAHVPANPTGAWWHPLLAAWWQAQVDPGFEMPANGRFVDRPTPAR